MIEPETVYRHEGTICTVWPYLRGHFDRDFLYSLWTLIEAENDWPSILWEHQESDTPISQHGDLVDWIHYMESLLDPKALLIVQDNLSGRIAGLIWFHRQKAESAHGAIWMSKKYRGQRIVREAVALGLEYAFYARNWKQVFAITPWPIARNLLKRCGFSQLAAVPDMFAGGTVYLMGMKECDYGRR